MKRKRTVKVAAAIFFGLLLVVTFFSNTFQQITLPKVKTVTPSFQELTFIIEGEGTLLHQNIVPVYDASGWKVEQIDVEVGDYVEKGQVLIKLDASTAHNALLDEKSRLKQQQLRLEQLQENYKLTAQTGDESTLRNAQIEMESLKLDIEIQERKIRTMQEKNESQATVAAPIDGVVTEVNATLGTSSNPGQPAVQMADLSQGLMWELTVDAELASNLEIGEEVSLYINGNTGQTVQATLEKIEDAGNMNSESGGSAGGEAANSPVSGKQLTFAVYESDLKGGERVGIKWEKKSGRANLTIPKDVVHTDNQGKYVYVVEEKKGPLGNQFTVQKRYVTLGKTDASKQVIQNGLLGEEQVVTESSEPLNEGERVRW
ncbi:efflux RND transporter periplasmic adaptor subunit [Paenibacillus montaniterrae]|nr:efflux RND transporter periplasmic adaptor subunit [Paenibacillus montaniterrae]